MVFDALERSGSRYMVVGGVAVVLHGHLRFTADLDVVLQLEASNALPALQALEGIGYRPRAPVQLVDLADAETRRSWVNDKGLTVLSLWNPDAPGTEVDLFVDEPFNFDDVYSRSISVKMGDHDVRVIGRTDLIAMKRAVGRPKDREDADVLESLSND